MPVDSTPRFTLDKRTYAPGDAVHLAFAQPVPSSGMRRAWITIVEANRSPESYGSWEFVTDRAGSAKLQAPLIPGVYEARIHTDYSTRMYNLRHSVRFEVAGATPNADMPETPLAKQRFSLDRSTYKPREQIKISFPSPMRAFKNERFWVTVVNAKIADSSYGDYEYVPDKATSMTLDTPRIPGDYEVRLHANYPRQSTNVVFRVGVQVR
jgi:hypothetical protein